MRGFLVAALLTFLAFSFPLQAGEPDAGTEAAKLIQSLHFQRGTVALPKAEATLKLQGEMRFLAGPDAERVLTELWGNPPGTEPLGMVLPSEDALSGDGSYAVVLTYNDEGYVSDKEAAAIDYDKMLKDMQAETREENPARKKAGYATVELIGWANRPHYDDATKKIYWAKELKFSGSGQNTLNYDVRVLGRKGYLSMDAVSGMGEFETIEAALPQLIAMAEFDPGARYADYSAGTDKLAAYGIAALVAGGVAAKAGLFGKLLAMLIAAKKLVLLLLAAIAMGFKKVLGWFKRKAV
jgi:uncharacterized membrane-anchored protein